MTNNRDTRNHDDVCDVPDMPGTAATYESACDRTENVFSEIARRLMDECGLDETPDWLYDAENEIISLIESLLPEEYGSIEDSIRIDDSQRIDGGVAK